MAAAAWVGSRYQAGEGGQPGHGGYDVERRCTKSESTLL
jgi:hypothetical protein